MTKGPAWMVFDLGRVADERAESGEDYLEFLRVPSLNAGLYELPAGADDPQSPHLEDEAYYVIEGRAKITVAGETTAVKPGSLIYVRAGVDHRFVEIAEDLKCLVFFSSARRS